MVTITTIVALIGPIVNWSTTGYVGVQYYKVEAADFPRFLSSILLIPLVNMAVLFAIFLLMRNLFADWLGIPSIWNLAIPFMGAAALLPQIAQTILAMRDRATSYALVEILGALINFLGTLILVLGLGFAWEGRVLAAALASTMLTVATLLWFQREGFLTRRFSPDDLVGSLRFGAGGVAHELASQALRLGDRLIIVTMLGQAAVGTYAVAVQWSSIMLTVLAAFNRAWVPFLFSALSKVEPGWANRIVRQTYLVWGAMLIFFMAFNVMTPLGYYLLVDNRYHSSMPASLWLTLGYLFNGIYMTVVDYIFFLKKTHILAMITTFNLALNIGLAYIFVGFWGSMGAAIAFACTAAIVMCLTFAISHRLHPMPWFRAAPQ